MTISLRDKDNLFKFKGGKKRQVSECWLSRQREEAINKYQGARGENMDRERERRIKKYKEKDRKVQKHMEQEQNELFIRYTSP